MEKPKEVKYVVKEGKHSHVHADGTRVTYRAGDSILLTEEYAALFSNKFIRASLPDTGNKVPLPKVDKEAAPVTAPTIKEMKKAVKMLPAIWNSLDLDFEDDKEALTVLQDYFGDLLTDDYREQIIAAFAPVKDKQVAGK